MIKSWGKKAYKLHYWDYYGLELALRHLQGYEIAKS